jgi:LemA protein
MGSWIIIGIIVLAALYLTFSYNSLVRMRNSVENAWHQIDVQLKRRHDLIPNLVEAVKGYMQFERDTLTQVVEARDRAVQAPNQEARIQAENQLTSGLGRLFALMENYPQLKADQNVLQMQEQLTTTENQIAFARQAYNDAVLELNNRIEIFPSNIIADHFGFHPSDYFKVPEEEQAVPKVELSLSTPRAS